MIPGATCEHCAHFDTCAETWREMTCRSFRPYWKKLLEDPATRRQTRAALKRQRKRIRKEIEDLNQ